MTEQTAAATSPAPNAQAHGGRLFQLDGLRGIAAFIIMFYHLEMVYRSHGPMVRGYLMVDLFFLLSGFVLAVSTEKKLLAGIGAFEFTWSRYVRLFPLVAVGVAVAVVRAFVIGMADPLTLLIWVALDLAMVPALTGSGPFYRYNGPQWTLFWELVANFVHALLLKRVPTKVLPVLVAAFGALLIYTARKHGSDTMGVAALTAKTWWMPIPRVAFPYVLGVWMGRLYKQGLRTRALPWQVALLLPVAGISVVPYLPLPKADGDLVFVVLFLPIMLWNVVQCRPPQSLARPMDWLGTFSLPLYCVHLTVLVWISELLGRDMWVRFVAVAVAMTLAWLFSRYVSFASKPTQVKAKPA